MIINTNLRKTFTCFDFSCLHQVVPYQKFCFWIVIIFFLPFWNTDSELLNGFTLFLYIKFIDMFYKHS
jgi:hypothetical protein